MAGSTWGVVSAGFGGWGGCGGVGVVSAGVVDSGVAGVAAGVVAAVSGAFGVGLPVGLQDTERQTKDVATAAKSTFFMELNRPLGVRLGNGLELRPSGKRLIRQQATLP